MSGGQGPYKNCRVADDDDDDDSLNGMWRGCYLSLNLVCASRHHTTDDGRIGAEMYLWYETHK
jgi:hypothetical protein